jgi:hypothetical protein
MLIATCAKRCASQATMVRHTCRAASVSRSLERLHGISTRYRVTRIGPIDAIHSPHLGSECVACYSLGTGLLNHLLRVFSTPSIIYPPFEWFPHS